MAALVLVVLEVVVWLFRGSVDGSMSLTVVLYLLVFYLFIFCRFGICFLCRFGVLRQFEFGLIHGCVSN